jgi:hypothetical protein
MSVDLGAEHYCYKNKTLNHLYDIISIVINFKIQYVRSNFTIYGDFCINF